MLTDMSVTGSRVGTDGELTSWAVLLLEAGESALFCTCWLVTSAMAILKSTCQTSPCFLQSRIHQSTYGKSLAIMTEAQLSTAVIENPEMLKYQRRQQQQQLDQKNATTRETSSASSVTGVVNGESLEDIRKVRAWSSGTKRHEHLLRDRTEGPNRWDMKQEVCTGHRDRAGA